MFGQHHVFFTCLRSLHVCFASVCKLYRCLSFACFDYFCSVLGNSKIKIFSLNSKTPKRIGILEFPGKFQNSKNIFWNFLFVDKLSVISVFWLPIETFTFWILFYWNPYVLFSLLVYWKLPFLTTFLLTSLLSEYFFIETSTFLFLSYWNLFFLFTFLLKCPLSDHFPIEIPTFSVLFYWNLCFLFLLLWNLHFLFIFLLKSLLSLYFSLDLSIEISTFWVLFYWNLYFVVFTFRFKSLLKW